MNSLLSELETELLWLREVIDDRTSGRFAPLNPPLYAFSLGPLSKLIDRLDLTAGERLIMALSLAPEIDSELLTPLFLTRQHETEPTLRFGGARGHSHGGFLPTGETACALLTESGQLSPSIFELLAPWSRLGRSGVVILDDPPNREPLFAGRLRCPPELVYELTTGKRPDAEYSAGFPASRMRTPMVWDDIVLPPRIKRRLSEVRDRILDSDQVWNGWGMREHHGEGTGLLVLFHGRPGTGKSMSAAVLGRECDRPVYRIDLSEVVSKYIGETEKNLARVFERAESEDWILFFDEADSLFARRGEVREARDRYANQEVSYLLQRIETFPGAVILATNKLGSIDSAFLRRIHLSIEFPEPDERCRYAIWQRVFPPADVLPLSSDVDLSILAQQYELTGAMIKNAAVHAAFLAASRKRRSAGRDASNGVEVTDQDLQSGIRREQEKSGRASVRRVIHSTGSTVTGSDPS